MKKLFTLICVTMASIAMFATDPVVIDFTTNPNNLTDQLQAETITVTSGCVTVTMEKASSTTVPILSTDMMKVYKNATLTISATENIKSISFVTNGSNYGADGFITVSTGTLTGNDWAGDAASVTFTADGHQVRLSSITVRFEDYVAPIVTVDTITVSEARARIDAGTLGECYVYGKVVSIDQNYISSYHNVNCWMTDLVNPTDTLEGYKMKGANNASYNDVADIEYAEGDTVLFYASSLKKYNAIYEINEGYYVATLGSAPAAPVTELTYTDVYVEYDLGDYTVTLSNGNAAQELTVLFAGARNAIAGTYTLNGENASFGEAEATGTLTIAFDRIEGNNYYYTFKANFTSGDVTYKSNDVIRVAGAYFEDNTNIDVAMALEICDATGQTATSIQYTVYGYIAAIKDAWSEQYGNISYYLSDDPNATTGTFIAYRVKTNLPVGTLVKLGPTTLVNYKGNTPECAQGAPIEAVNAADVPELRQGEEIVIETISADRAFEIGNALEGKTGETVNTEKTYRVIGYVAKIKEDWTEQYKNQTFFLCNSDTATYGQLQVYRGKSDRALEVHEKIAIVGKISKYTYDDGGASVQVAQPNCEITDEPVPNDATAIENLYMDLKAAKVVINGEVVIIRNGRRYNLVGARL